MVIEKYRVTMEHFYEFVEPGELPVRSDIDTPFHVECCCDPRFAPPNSLVLNNIMDRLREEVLTRARVEVKP